MGNLLRIFWDQLFGRRDDRARSSLRWKASLNSTNPTSPAIFLIMRRMRAPLIILIVIFAVSVIGLTVIPGQDGQGRPARVGFFDAFYFMSYTATTIGFGELPNPFTAAQRLWVMGTIYLTVVGWAYAIGAILSLLQDRAFRQALALRSFTRKVAALREPFLLMAGYGRTGELLRDSFITLGQQFVVVDLAPERIDALDLSGHGPDVPGLVGDARNPDILKVAGLGHPYCTGVLALTNDDEVNLAVTMSAVLLRPDVPVIARTASPVIGDRMRAFGTPAVVNPFDRYGDHLLLSLRAPSSHQLMSWLESGPGSPKPARGEPPRQGRWVICGYGRFGRELTSDLRSGGLEVTVLDTTEPHDRVSKDPLVLIGDASDPDLLARAELSSAVGFVAGTHNDTTNLSLLAAARAANPDLFLGARQNEVTSAPLFQAMSVDFLLVPTELIAREVYAQLSTPLLWRFLQEMPQHGDEWAAALVSRLEDHCGQHLEALTKLTLTATAAPTLSTWLDGDGAKLGDLLRSPADRSVHLHVVPLLVQHGDDCTLSPAMDFQLHRDDQLLLAGRPGELRALELTLTDASTAEYVLYDRRVPASWIWRRLRHQELVADAGGAVADGGGAARPVG